LRRRRKELGWVRLYSREFAGTLVNVKPGIPFRSISAKILVRSWKSSAWYSPAP